MYLLLIKSVLNTYCGVQELMPETNWLLFLVCKQKKICEVSMGTKAAMATVPPTESQTALAKKPKEEIIVQPSVWLTDVLWE